MSATESVTRTHRVKSLFPRNGRAAPTRPVSSWYMRYASRRWSGDKGPFSPRRSWTARAARAEIRSQICHVIRGATFHTFLYDFANEDFGEPGYDLSHGHGDLLTEALLNYLAKRRVRI